MDYSTISLASNTNLQQLSVDVDASIPDVFMETISALGGLVHVAFTAMSITTKGIDIHITNSSEFLTLHISSREIYNVDLIKST